MKQTQAIDTILAAVQQDEAVLAAFLKGSLAGGTGDEFSDVDFYCLVPSEQIPAFLARRRNILECYRPILFWADVNFVGPQVVSVFDDGLHFDLYTVTPETLPMAGSMQPLYDPQHLLADYHAEPQSLTLDEVVYRFDSFSFTLHEFEAAFRRNRMIWATHLVSHLPAEIGFVYRYLHDHDYARLSLKHIDQIIDEAARQRLIDASQANPLTGVLRYCDLMRDIVHQYPPEQQSSFNWDFFDFMVDRLSHLDRG